MPHRTTTSRRPRSWLVPLVAAATVPSPTTAQAPEGGPSSEALTVEQVVDFRGIPSQSSPILSPGSGAFVAFTVEGPRRTVGLTRPLLDEDGATWTRLRVVETSTGRSSALGRTTWGGAWSPDGTRLAYLAVEEGSIRLRVRDAGRPEGARSFEDADLWVTWVATLPAWTPDGRSVVVKVLPEGIGTGEMLRRATPGASTAPDATAPEGGPGDGSTVRVFRSDQAPGPRGDRGRPATLGARQTGGNGAVPGWMRWEYGGDLAAVDVESGRVERLTSDRLPVSWRVAPDGRRVAIMELADLRDDGVRFRVTLVSLEDGTVTELPGWVTQTWGRGISWSPDGSRLAYLSRGDEGEAGLFVADAATGARARVASLREGWDADAPPVWSASGRVLLLAARDTLWRVEARLGTAGTPTPLITLAGYRTGDLVAPRSAPSLRPADDGTVLLRVTDRRTEDPGFARVHPGTRRVLTVRTEPGSYGGGVGTDLAGDGSLAVARFSTTRQAPELWRLGPGLRRQRRVSDLHPGFDPSILGEDRLVRWSTEDGDSLEGTVLLPPGFQSTTPVPLVVQVYGGDAGANALHRFDRHRQLLASNGYAVLVPDVPLRVPTPMADHARAVLPGIDRLIELGIADPGRIGVTGHSYGGYGTLALLVQSGRFAAAAASAAQGDLVANYGHMAADGTSRTRWSEAGQGRMGTTLWDAPERYRDNSPVLFLDRVTTPLLLLHGGEDPTVPVWLAEEIFVGLRRLGRPVTLALYEGEGHWSGDWSIANQTDYWRRLLEWFDRYMGPKTRGAGR